MTTEHAEAITPVNPIQEIEVGEVAVVGEEPLAPVPPSADAPASPPYRLPPLTLLSLIIEVVLIWLAIVLFARTYQNFDPTLRPAGGDWMFLLSSGGYSAQVLRETGRIPLWNPFMGTGEPSIEGVLSYVLNPFMFLPIVWGGIVNGGKLAILIHTFLMAYGGWLLGRVLRMHAPGRILLALLLAGSGGFAASIGEGHYQIGLSQAYMPWIYAGLIGTLYMRRRWPIVLLAVSTMLMIFAGSFWYVLPTGIVCALLCVLGVVDWTNLRRLVLRSEALRRVLTAVVLIVLLSAIRLLPQLNATRYFIHPQEELIDYYPLQDVMEVYFAPTAGVAQASFWLRYAYIFPGAVALGLVVLFVLIPGAGKPRSSTLVILVASLFGIIFFTWWAMGATPLFVSLYHTFGWLGNWRRMGRLAAAAAPLIAILLTLMFDSLVTRLWTLIRQRQPFVVGFNLSTLNLTLRLPTLIGQALLLGMLAIAGIVCVDVLDNWQRVTRLEPVDPLNGRFRGITYTRLAYPTKFLSIDTFDICTSIELYTTMSRSLVGNPEIAIFGMPNTINTDRLNAQPAEFAAGYNYLLLASRAEAGYEPVPGAPVEEVPIAWQNPKALSYAFLVPQDILTAPAGVLERAETQVIESYDHHIDSVNVHIAHHLPNEVLVIFETAYPGWTVNINGSPAQVESVGGRLGVVLPADTEPVEVEFKYRPTILYVGAVISAIGLLVCLGFIFRLDIWANRRLGGLYTFMHKVWTVIVKVATQEV